MIRARARALARAALEAALSPRVAGSRGGARLWRLALAAPGLPDHVRGRLALRVAATLVTAGRTPDAAAIAAAAAGRVRPARLRARLLGASMDPDPSHCRLPPVMREWWATELAETDAHYARGETAAAGKRAAAAMALAFHRGLHFDRLCSPLAEDPQGFLAPLRGSRAMAAMNGATRLRPPEPPVGRPLRLLITFHKNDNFLGAIARRYADHPDVELRYVNLASDPELRILTHNARLEDMSRALLDDASPFRTRVEQALRPHLDWADTVFVEWCTAPAVALTMVDPGRCRVIVRLHSYELFTAWPHLVNFGRVDDLVLVSEHMRAFALAVLPRLADPGGPRLSVVANVVGLEPFVRPKPATARFTLGLVGIGTVAKDPRWAIEVLRRLRSRDSRYRLVLVGEDMDATVSGVVSEYRRLLESDLSELEPEGAVRRLGPTDDIPAALVDIGVILSTSVRESFHLGLMEGAASGAVPVVRDWPFFVASGGARGLFPADWVVDSPEGAADRVLRLTATDAQWRAAGAAASAHALATWDRSVTLPEFDGLLLGRADDVDRPPRDGATMEGSAR